MLNAPAINKWRFKKSFILEIKIFLISKTLPGLLERCANLDCKS